MKAKYLILNEAIQVCLFVALIIGGILLAACNTMEGVGTDIKMTGKALEESAELNKTSSIATAITIPGVTKTLCLVSLNI